MERTIEYVAPFDRCDWEQDYIGEDISALAQPVTFRKTEYIRVGSYTKKLMEYPALQSRLWNRLHNVDYETMLSWNSRSG